MYFDHVLGIGPMSGQEDQSGKPAAVGNDGNSFGRQRGGVVREPEVPTLFRGPVLFTYNYIWMMRTEKRLLPLLLGALCAALLASGVTGIFLGNNWFAIPLILPFVLIALYNRL
jgi:hypothetical protein